MGWYGVRRCPMGRYGGEEMPYGQPQAHGPGIRGGEMSYGALWGEEMSYGVKEEPYGAV